MNKKVPDPNRAFALFCFKSLHCVMSTAWNYQGAIEILEMEFCFNQSAYLEKRRHGIKKDALDFVQLRLLLLKGGVRVSSADIRQFSGAGAGRETMLITANFSVLFAAFGLQACFLWI